MDRENRLSWTTTLSWVLEIPCTMAGHLSRRNLINSSKRCGLPEAESNLRSHMLDIKSLPTNLDSVRQFNVVPLLPSTCFKTEHTFDYNNSRRTWDFYDYSTFVSFMAKGQRSTNRWGFSRLSTVCESPASVTWQNCQLRCQEAINSRSKAFQRRVSEVDLEGHLGLVNVNVST